MRIFAVGKAMHTSQTILLGKSLAELTALVTSLGMPAFTGKQLAKWIYQKGARTIDEMTDISRVNRATLSAQCCVGRMAAVQAQRSSDGTVKYLFPVVGVSPQAIGESSSESRYVEAVYIPEGDRATLCVSSQVGCKMGCTFCQTARQGFEANITAGDILNQVYEVGADTLTNIVFMGQGEPMDNLDNVLRATELLQAPYALAWSPRRITVSSVGVRTRLKRFLDESDCHVAISLHTPLSEQRAMMMPAERAMPLSDVISLLRDYDFAHQRRLTFEYICFGGLNDSHTHTKELIRLLRGMPCRVNLLRFHRIEGVDLPSTDEQRMQAMADRLNAQGITTTIRRSRGEDIDAACGMLISKQRQ